MMAPRSGERFLFIACGTGLGMPAFARAVGAGGKVIGIDLSAPMLRRAERRMRRAGLNNAHFLRADLTTLDADALARHGAAPPFDGVVAALALSVVPCWREIFHNTWNWLAPAGRYGLLDWHRPRRDGVARFVNATASADVTRDTPGLLHARAVGVEEERRLFGNVVVMCGRKEPAS